MKTTVLGLVLATFVIAAPGGASADADEDLRAKTQNPVGSLISVPFENNIDFGAPDGIAYVLNFQPIIPVSVGDWNLISRPILPIAYVQGRIGGLPGLPSGSQGNDVFGLGDLNYSLFVSPVKVGKVIWGVGPSFTLRTATDSQLGSGKWSAGATAVFLAQPKPWSVGLLVRHLWSFAGDDDRKKVRQFLVQPFVNYNFDGGWFLFSDPTITANWKAGSNQKWTLPLGGGVGRLFNIGKQPVNMRLGAFGNAVRPDFAPKWALKFSPFSSSSRSSRDSGIPTAESWTLSAVIPRGDLSPVPRL
jgi:hypothetical protein